MTRAEILDEFGSAACENECEAGDCISERKMADEIVRLRAILDKLREPSEAVIDCMTLPLSLDHGRWNIAEALCAAVAAAEQEVGS